MFKELKVVKLVIIVGLLLALIWKMDFTSLAISELYTDKLSYKSSEQVEIYTSTNSVIPYDTEIEIKGLTTDYSEMVATTISSQQKPVDVLRNGFNYENFVQFELSSDLETGIYSIAGKYPLVIKSEEISEMTVVYPMMNNIIYHNVGEKNVFSEGCSKTSLLRTSIIDRHTLGFASFLKELTLKYNVNYITDIDLENEANFSKTGLLVIYGKTAFWTGKMQENVISFQKNGGNILNITSYFSNNICWFQKPNEVRLMDSSKAINSWESIDSSQPLSFSGGKYNYAGFSNDNYYEIINKSHPIFDGVIKDSVEIEAGLFLAPPVSWSMGEPRISLDKMYGYSGEILAYSKASYNGYQGVKGIFVYQPAETSGKVVVLGTEDWCTQGNIGENQQLQLITNNSIKYLLE